MTKQIDDFLDIPHEDDLKDNKSNNVTTIKNPTTALSVQIDNTHEIESDEIRKKALELQEEIAEVARNIEPGRSARMFEVSGQHLKLALEASISKEKLKIDAARLKLEAAKLKVDDDTVNSLNNGAQIVADRNVLIKQLLAEDEIIDVDDNIKK